MLHIHPYVCQRDILCFLSDFDLIRRKAFTLEFGLSQWQSSKKTVSVWCSSSTAEGALETFAQMEREREVQSRSGDCAVSRRSRPVINVKDNVLGK